jgi:hypothetical protein
MITNEQIKMAADIVKANKQENRVTVMTAFMTYFMIQDPQFHMSRFVSQCVDPYESIPP